MAYVIGHAAKGRTSVPRRQKIEWLGFCAICLSLAFVAALTVLL